MYIKNSKGTYICPSVETINYNLASLLCDSAEVMGSAGTEDLGEITNIEW